MEQAIMLRHYQSAGEMPYKSHHKTHKKWDYGRVFLFENVAQLHQMRYDVMHHQLE